MRPVEPDHFRAVMGHFATGVTVITAPGPVGMTANAVTSLSLEPLLLLVCFHRRARTLPVVEQTGRFGVNVLARGQEEIARRFAGKAEGKFDDVPHALHDEGVPILDNCLAWVGCRLEQLVPGGDHVIGIGCVTAAETGSGEPLVWYRGGYGSFTTAT
jgi:3-hydroxy-9,10-secoandrosta-1,3,5(10)-triene-9,17-dione monooxygenase reductase component